MLKFFIPSLALATFASTFIAHAGKVTTEEGDLVCVVDKWEETELEKGHKLADAAMRCVLIHDDPTAEKTIEECAGKYEYIA
ncbi:MAG: hypothetical protein ACR2GC_09745 [Methyloceanibacter sp.]|uniref:hypothetical protein n=1 Tax=Methyloceanibacter sp. TaxID=1965321 RepID=UPI003D9B1F29